MTGWDQPTDDQPTDDQLADDLPRSYDELLERLPECAGTAADRRRTRRLIAARVALEEAERELVAAVRDSFEGGDSWRTIGTALGISRQGAQRRFADQGIGLAALGEQTAGGPA